MFGIEELLKAQQTQASGGSKKLSRKQTAPFNGQLPRPSTSIDDPRSSGKAVRPKRSLWSRADPINDTVSWLTSEDLLSTEELKWLNSLSKEDRTRLQKLLKLPRYFGKSHVRNPKDRLNVQAQVILMAARTRNLDQAEEHRARLTEKLSHTKTRLFEVLDPRTNFDPYRIADLSKQRRATNRLLRRIDTVDRVGDLARPRRVREATRTLIDNGLLDARAATRLRRAFKYFPNRINNLMQIDHKSVPKLADRQRIRSAVLLRLACAEPNSDKELREIDRRELPAVDDHEAARSEIPLRLAHFQTEQARKLKQELIADATGCPITIPELNNSEAKREARSTKDSINLPHVQLDDVNVDKPEPLNTGGLFENTDRDVQIDVELPPRELLPPLGPGGSTTEDGRKRWLAIAKNESAPRHSVTDHGSDWTSDSDEIKAIVNRVARLQQNKLNVSWHQDARRLLEAINRQLPRSMPLSARLQALGEAAAILFQERGQDSDDRSPKRNLEHATDALRSEKKQRRTDPVPIDNPAAVRRELFIAAASAPIPNTWIFSPALREIIDLGRMELEVEESRPWLDETLNAVLGEDLSQQEKEEVFKLLRRQMSSSERRVFGWVLKLWAKRDQTWLDQNLKPIRNRIKELTLSPPASGNLADPIKHKAYLISVALRNLVGHYYADNAPYSGMNITPKELKGIFQGAVDKTLNDLKHIDQGILAASKGFPDSLPLQPPVEWEKNKLQRGVDVELKWRDRSHLQEVNRNWQRSKLDPLASADDEEDESKYDDDDLDDHVQSVSVPMNDIVPHDSSHNSVDRNEDRNVYNNMKEEEEPDSQNNN